jgi:PAS domain S-box-containing protein
MCLSARLAALAILGFPGLTSLGQTGPIPVRIGVVATSPPDIISSRYAPLTGYLAARIPSHTFRMVSLQDVDGLFRAVERREVEFAFCSPTMVVQLDVRFGARPLVTQEVAPRPGSSTPWMAGAAFCLDSRRDIRTLADLRGKRVVGLDPRALGGWLSVLRELNDLGIHPPRDFAEVHFSSDYETVVRAVLNGSSDAGVLSAAAYQIAAVREEERRRLRVLPPFDPLPPDFPYPASTRLYPEAPLVSFSFTPAKLADHVTVALLSVPPESVPMPIAAVSGFTLPPSYQSVHDLLRELGLPPYSDYGKVTLAGAMRQHWNIVLLTLLTIVLALSVAAFTALRLNRSLRRSQASLASRAQMLNQAGDAIAAVDLDWKITFWNAAAERLLGWTASETLGRHADLVFSAAGEQLLAVVRDQLSATGSWSGETSLRTRSGDCVTGELSVASLRDMASRPVGYIGSFRDVSEIRKLQDQYRQAQKLESVGRLAGGIAHDFNNLLTVINGYSDLILSSLDNSHPDYARIAEIHKAGRRAAGLTRQLLAFSRKQFLNPVPLDLNAVIRDSDSLLRTLLGEDIDLQIALDPSPLPVLADATQLQQVLLNLAVNARDAMPRGGIVAVRTGREGAAVFLSVTDTGSGMTPEVQGRIFEPFFTTKEVGKGSGLGLSTVFGIVQQSGGAISVSSQPGKGSSFVVRLPLLQQHPSTLEAGGPDSASPRGAETVLIVEDAPNVRELAAEVLSSLGYHVLSAAGPDEALQLSHASSAPINLLLTDFVMPGMNGKDLARLLVREHAGLRTLFMSGYTTEFIPSSHFLPKPFTPDTLARKVREALGDGDEALKPSSRP